MELPGIFLASVNWLFNLIRFIFCLLGILCAIKFLSNRR